MSAPAETELVAAVRAFLAKWERCEPHLADAFLHREIRVGPYSGPSVTLEISELRRLVAHRPNDDL
ncbi:MAG: hypothetical protein AAF205_11600 [Pseudomonadota bacterium]